MQIRERNFQFTEDNVVSGADHMMNGLHRIALYLLVNGKMKGLYVLLDYP